VLIRDLVIVNPTKVRSIKLKRFSKDDVAEVKAGYGKCGIFNQRIFNK